MFLFLFEKDTFSTLPGTGTPAGWQVSILILIFLNFLAENIIYNAAGCKHAGRFSAQTQKD